MDEGGKGQHRRPNMEINSAEVIEENDKDEMIQKLNKEDKEKEGG